jgi:hypothetical protein
VFQGTGSVEGSMAEPNWVLFDIESSDWSITSDVRFLADGPESSVPKYFNPMKILTK